MPIHFFSVNRFALLLLFCLGWQITQAQSPHLMPTDREAITEVLMAQQAAWNRGDIEAFMQGYWQSDSLTFVGGNGVTYGWQATLAGYQRRYPDRQTMGQLSFGIERLAALGPDAALLIGTWRLTQTRASLGDRSAVGPR